MSSVPFASIQSKNGFREMGLSGGVDGMLKVGVNGDAARFRNGLLEESMTVVEGGEGGRSVSSSMN